MLALVVTVAFLRTRFAWDKSCELARAQLPGLLGLDVGILSCEVDPLTQSVVLHDVSAFERESHRPLFTADSIRVGIAGLSPFLGRLELSRLEVRRPRVKMDLSHPTAAPLPMKPGASPPCALESLRRLEVETLDVQGAEISVVLPEGRRVEMSNLNLGWKTRRGVAEFHVETSQGVLNFGDGGADVALSGLRVEGGLNPNALELEIQRGELTLEDFNVSVSGSIEQLCRPTLALDAQAFLPLRTLGKAVGLKTALGGHVWAHASIAGRLEALRLSTEILGRGVAIAGFRPGDFKARMSLAGPELSVQELSFNPGSGGAVHVTGSLQLTPGLPVRAQVELKGASLGHILERTGIPGAWVDFAGTGKGSVQGKLLPAPRLSGELELDTDRFVLSPHAFDATVKGTPLLAFPGGHVQLGFKVLPDRVEIAPLHLRVERSKAEGEVTLFFDPGRGMRIEARSEGLELSELGPLAGIPWMGHATTEVLVEGPYREVHIDGAVGFHDFEFSHYQLGVAQARLSYRHGVLAFPGVTGQKGRTLYSGAGELDFRGPEQVTRGQVQVAQGRVEDLVDILAKRSSTIALLQGDLGGRASGSLKIESPGDRFSGALELALSNVTYKARRLGESRVKVRFVNGEAMVLDPTSLRGPLGELSMGGRYSFDGPLDFDLRADPLDLAELLGPERAQSLGVSGTLAFVGKVEGTSDVPQLSAYLTSPGIAFAQRNLGPMHLEARMEGQSLQIFGRPFGDAHASARVKLHAPFPFETNLQLTLPEIRPLLPDVAISRGLSGSLSGSVAATGNLGDVKATRATATLDRLFFRRGDFSGQTTGPVSLAYARGRLDVETFQFQGLNTELSLGGFVGAAAGPDQVDVKMRGTLDMRLLESFVPLLDRTGGTVEVSASATGPLKSPSLVGSAEIHDARFSVRDQPVDVRALSGRLNFSAARVLLDEFTGVLNDGRISLRGDLTLDHFTPERVELGLQMDDVHWRFSEDLPFTTSGEVLLSGKTGALTLSGDLDVQKLRYDRPVVVESFLRKFSKGSSGWSGSGERPREWLSLDVGVHLKDARVENNVGRARLLGDLKLTGTNVSPGLLGTLETGEGSQAFFRGSQFIITQGLMEFKDRNGFDGLFDIHAETQVRDYLVRLHAFGRPSDPQLILSSEPALAEGDLISLLTLGVTSHDKGDSLKTGIGIGADLLFTASGLDKQVQRFLPKNNVLRDLSFHISSAYSELTGLVEPTAQLESKFLTEQLKLRMSQPVSGRGTRAQAEYRFDDRVSAQAQWDNEHSETAFGGNLGLDLKLRWEIE